MNQWIKTGTTAAILCISILLVGCGAQPTVAPFTSPPQPAPEATMTRSNEQFSPLPTPRALTTRRDSSLLENLAQRDLAQRLNIGVESVEIVSAEQTEMPAGSLGCGETGGRQNQGLIIGTEIVLRAEGQEYTYHADGSKLVPCAPAAFPGGQRPLYVTGVQPTGQPAMQDLAVADLAGRLDIAPDAITVREMVAVEWPDASLGCPQPGMMYAQVITPGYRIVLEAQGQAYQYHASRNHIVFCSPRR